MEIPFTCLSDEVKRLSTFQRTPLPNDKRLCISNSPAKLAKAGFSRRENATDDVVFCEYCGIEYGDWNRESPFAVHRVLNEKCLFLSKPADSEYSSNVLGTRRRRRLFSDIFIGDAENAGAPDANDVESVEVMRDSSPYSDMLTNNENVSTEMEPAYISVLNPSVNFAFPFQPKVGDPSMLFASRRLKTFINPETQECIEWSEEGFVYRNNTRDVQCIFCAVILPFHTGDPKQLHAEKSKLCPRVLFKDVGNISAAEEEIIKRKNLQRELKNKSSQRSYAICHPQYEDENVRMGTFENWPCATWVESLGARVMSQAGFFYTGLADKVKCYSCGVGLYKWRQGSDPWQQHALHLPSCPHLLDKGQNFIQKAKEAQVLTEADVPLKSISTAVSPKNTGQLVMSPPGSLTMDVCAVTAALETSQYTSQQVRQAVLTFFCHTSRYPTKDILLGTLRAAEENFTTVCQQREAIHQKDSQLQQHRTELQQHLGINEQLRQEVQHQRDIIQQQQQRELQLQQRELQLHREAWQAMQVLEDELQRQAAESERKIRQLRRFDQQQIESLRVQMQALLAERREAGHQAEPLRPAPPIAQEGLDHDAIRNCDIRCKVCLSEESNTIFQPCHHITCCSHCAQQLVSACCPVCRAPISGVLPAYIT